MVVLAIPGSIPIGSHGLPVSPEDQPLGTLHRKMLDRPQEHAGRFVCRVRINAYGTLVDLPSQSQTHCWTISNHGC
ncbi:hypothetical protein B9Z19DRAFT_1087834 [Tuber borchii]|uniref:Uncharacterized protein n=1 Tax=Tuber borchii TaxID=42251 RepID=A0A2T6ZMF2_TUBBO|nr:hypothetical protein B9Z19DRAFT_1087834 [Tuber borchii]